MLNIRLATVGDITQLLEYDRRMSARDLARIVPLGHVLMAFEGARLIGWLRYGMFWDEIPCMHLLSLMEGERGKGRGRAMVEDWENRMRQEGRTRVMTSTQADETAQHFYRKLGYRDAGVLILPGQAAELLFIKEL
ncbi:MAG TPA: GNAT family N-acetyltransferase [Candidatus Limiplasma sp.]|nr:GNAT family N-acetyltransferase [Candidatus Limiplasma sp.]HPS81095.1 GNAT family N-acetyltransferase [Candidatus Limiplasma sp.]